VKLGFENRRNAILAAVLGVVAILVAVYEFMPSSSTIASTATVTNSGTTPPNAARPATRHGSGSAPGKKERAPQSLDPTLRLQQLAATEQIKYEGSGRNIFVSQAEVAIPTPLAPGATDKGKKDAQLYQPQTSLENPRKFSSPKATMFSLPARVRLWTAATRLCASLRPRWIFRT
jgi:hypothetical protein